MKFLFNTFIYISSLVNMMACSKADAQLDYSPNFDIIQDESNSNLYTIRDNSKGDYFYYRWIFGNGERTDRIAVNDSDFSVFYPVKGDYNIELTIWGDKSDLADNKSISKTLSVANDVFTADFIFEKVSGQNNVFLLKNTSSGSYSKAEWIVDNLQIDDNSDGVEVYLPFKGNYNITLKLSEENYSDSISKSIQVDNNDLDFKNKMNLVWSDEFDGNTLDQNKWKFETGQSGWGNEELQNYTDGQNYSIESGLLKITAELVGTGQKVGDYTSSRINSIESFKYGVYEIKAKMPDYKGPGVWPAIWMLGKSIQNGTSWPLCGEIDIMEYVSWDPNKTSSTIHIESNNHALGNPIGSGHLDLETAEEAFHIYGLIWSESFLSFYRDQVDNVILRYPRPLEFNQENWPFDKEFYFLLNIAVGGNYGGVNGVDDSNFPSTMEIDYVRVYQMK